MRIDPKTFTLDANERHVIEQALKCYVMQRKRFLGRFVGNPTHQTVESNQRAEMQIERAHDLLRAMTSPSA